MNEPHLKRLLTDYVGHITMTARISDSGREHLTAGFAPRSWVASFLTSGSAGYTIVTIGMPDPKRMVLKPQPELHPYIYAGHCQRQLR